MRVEPPALDRRRRGEAEAHAVQRDGNLRGERAERAALAAARVEVVVGDHLDDVDAVEVREDRRGQLRPPAESEAVRHASVPPPPPQPPHPPPPPPPPHEEPHDEPHDEPDARCRLRVQALA